MQKRLNKDEENKFPYPLIVVEKRKGKMTPREEENKSLRIIDGLQPTRQPFLSTHQCHKKEVS